MLHGCARRSHQYLDLAGGRRRLGTLIRRCPVPNKWLEWAPSRDEVIRESATHEPSRPSELGFDGFEGQPHGLLPIIRVHEEAPRSGPYVIEKAGDPAPSKPSEPPTGPAPSLVP